MATNFDEARQATEDLFGGQAEQGAEEQPAQEQSTEEQIPPPQDEQPQQEETQTNEQAQIEDAANIAQAAVQTAEQSNQQSDAAQMQIQQLMAENQQLRQANTELQDTITQQSQQQQERIVDEAMEMPMLDMNALAFEDENTIRQMQQDYANKMRDFVMGGIKKEIEPAVQYAREGIRERERAEVINALKEVPELSGIEGMIPRLDRIIKANKVLSSDDTPMDEKYIMAYGLARGADAMNTPPPPPPSEPTAEKLMEYYRNNPEFQEMIEKDRLENIKQSQQVPAMSASNGAVNAALNIPEKPKTWDDASERTRKMFRADD